MCARHLATVITLFAAIVNTACTSGDISASIAKQYKESKGTSVNLAIAAPGEWDRVCIVGPYANNDRAKKILGFYWDVESESSITLNEGISLLLFVRNQDVIFHVEHSREEGDFTTVSSKCFTQSEAVFFYDVNPKTGRGGLYSKHAA